MTALKPKSARPLPTLLLAVLVAGRAFAQATPSAPADADVTVFSGAPLRVVVARFDGPGAEILRGAVVRALEAEPSLDVVPVRFYQQAGRELDGTAQGYAAVARRLSLAAILRGRAAQDGLGYSVTISVVSGETGEIVSRVRFAGKRPAAIRPKIQRELWPFLEPLLRPTAPPEPPAPSASTGPTDGAAAAASPAAPPSPPRRELGTAALPRPGPAPPARCPWLTAGLGGGVTRRLFAYENEQRGPLRNYTLVRSPIAGADVAMFPFASETCTATRGPGFAAGYEQLVGAKSYVGGRTLATFAFVVQAELLWRVRVSTLAITPRAGYRLRHFRVEDDVVPDVAYHAARLALELSLDAGPVFAEFTGSGSLMFGTGELGADDWFRNTSGSSFGADARLGVPLFTSMSILVGGQFEMYALRFNLPADSDAPRGVADGATDRYFSASLSARIELPWKGPRP